MELFWKVGYDAVSVRSLADALSISQSSLYAAYGNKADLYLETLAAFEREYRINEMSAVLTATSLDEAVHTIIEAAIGRYTIKNKPRGCMILSGRVADISGQRKLWLKLRDRRRGHSATLQHIFSTWLPQDASIAARYIFAVMIGLSGHARDGLSAKELRQFIDPTVAAVRSCSTPSLSELKGPR